MTIAVPVGKRIKITNKGWSQTNVRINNRGMRTGTIDRISSDENWYDEWNEPWDGESYDFEKGVEYKMTTTGLEKIKRDDDIDSDDEINKDNNDTPDELEEKIIKLKEERLRLEKKTSLPNTNKTNSVTKMASKFTDLQWVLDRFSY
jgi:hypothetical protein